MELWYVFEWLNWREKILITRRCKQGAYPLCGYSGRLLGGWTGRRSCYSRELSQKRNSLSALFLCRRNSALPEIVHEEQTGQKHCICESAGKCDFCDYKNLSKDTLKEHMKKRKNHSTRSPPWHHCNFIPPPSDISLVYGSSYTEQCVHQAEECNQSTVFTFYS